MLRPPSILENSSIDGGLSIDKRERFFPDESLNYIIMSSLT